MRGPWRYAPDLEAPLPDVDELEMPAQPGQFPAQTRRLAAGLALAAERGASSAAAVAPAATRQPAPADPALAP
jgi:hypothetical protein